MGTEEGHKSEDDSLAGRIRKAARESGETVYRLAQLAELDQSTLNKFLNGTRGNLRLDMADRLCRALGLELVGRHPIPRGRTKKSPVE